MEKSTTWNYNGNSFEFDIHDEETAERYESALADLKAKEKNIPKTGKLSEVIHSHCAFYKKAFDNFLGEGAGEKIIGDKANIRIATEAFCSFLSFCYDQRKAIEVITANVAKMKG